MYIKKCSIIDKLCANIVGIYLNVNGFTCLFFYCLAVLHSNVRSNMPMFLVYGVNGISSSVHDILLCEHICLLFECIIVILNYRIGSLISKHVVIMPLDQGLDIY